MHIFSSSSHICSFSSSTLETIKARSCLSSLLLYSPLLSLPLFLFSPQAPFWGGRVYGENPKDSFTPLFPPMSNHERLVLYFVVVLFRVTSFFSGTLPLRRRRLWIRFGGAETAKWRQRRRRRLDGTVGGGWRRPRRQRRRRRRRRSRSEPPSGVQTPKVTKTKISLCNLATFCQINLLTVLLILPGSLSSRPRPDLPPRSLT